VIVGVDPVRDILGNDVDVPVIPSGGSHTASACESMSAA